MSAVAVLEEPVKMSAEELEREIFSIVGLISEKNLPRVLEFVKSIGAEEDAEYPEHSDKDFSPEFRASVNRALSEEGVVTTYEEFKKWLYEFTAEVRARNDEKIAV